MDWEVICGDSRHVLAEHVAEPCVMITDPPWPDAPAGMFEDCADVGSLIADVLEPVAAHLEVAVIVLGCASDPRVLRVPDSLAYVRTCWLRYAVPSRRGTTLNSADLAYVFGRRRRPHGAYVLPGECTFNGGYARPTTAHPCPRRVEHMAWLVRWFTKPGELMVDPFCGSATTGLAALGQGRRFLGIDRVPKWADEATARLAAFEAHTSTADIAAGQGALFAAAKP